MTSIVGQLTPVVNPFEAVARAFPPGSMTGAPKLRSVRLLEQLEQDKSRGVYAGESPSILVAPCPVLTDVDRRRLWIRRRRWNDRFLSCDSYHHYQGDQCVTEHLSYRL